MAGGRGKARARIGVALREQLDVRVLQEGKLHAVDFDQWPKPHALKAARLPVRCAGKPQERARASGERAGKRQRVYAVHVPCGQHRADTQPHIRVYFVHAPPQCPRERRQRVAAHIQPFVALPAGAAAENERFQLGTIDLPADALFVFLHMIFAAAAVSVRAHAQAVVVVQHDQLRACGRDASHPVGIVPHKGLVRRAEGVVARRTVHADHAAVLSCVSQRVRIVLNQRAAVSQRTDPHADLKPALLEESAVLNQQPLLLRKTGLSLDAARGAEPYPRRADPAKLRERRFAVERAVWKPVGNQNGDTVHRHSSCHRVVGAG